LFLGADVDSVSLGVNERELLWWGLWLLFLLALLFNEVLCVQLRVMFSTFFPGEVCFVLELSLDGGKALVVLVSEQVVFAISQNLILGASSL